MLEQFNEKFCNLTISLLPQIVMTTIRVFSKNNNNNNNNKRVQTTQR